MKAVDARNETWESLMQRVEGTRMEVYRLLEKHGPCTSRRLSFVSGHISLISMRPRVTELLQLGMVKPVGREKTDTGSETIFEAIPIESAKVAFERRHCAGDPQGVLF